LIRKQNDQNQDKMNKNNYAAQNPKRPILTVGALVFNNEEIILLKSQKWGGRYIIPCGHVEFEETIEYTVQREVLEETGLKVKNLHFLRFIEFINNPQQYYKKNMHYVGMQYACQTTRRDVRLNEESSEYLWTPPQKAFDQNLEWGSAITIRHYVQRHKDNPLF